MIDRMGLQGTLTGTGRSPTPLDAAAGGRRIRQRGREGGTTARAEEDSAAERDEHQRGEGEQGGERRKFGLFVDDRAGCCRGCAW